MAIGVSYRGVVNVGLVFFLAGRRRQTCGEEFWGGRCFEEEGVFVGVCVV